MIPVYNPIFTEDDAKAVHDVVMSQYVTHIGKETALLEETFEKDYNRKYALACANGTAALHLALVALNLEGKTIAVPACAFAAVGFAPAYVNCKTMFIDVDQNTWNMDLGLLEEACKKTRIDAIIAVHNYGNTYDYPKLRGLQDKYKFFIIEDACEAMGAWYGDTEAGKLGDVSVFSFYGNKMVSGGEGGMLLTNLDHADDKACLFRSQALSKKKRFWHEAIGHNFRLTNIQSALILSQYKRKWDLVHRAKEVAECYKKYLSSDVIMQEEAPNVTHCWWMISVVHRQKPHFYNIASEILKEAGYDSRPVFQPMPLMPPWIEQEKNNSYPNAEFLADRGISLPSGPGLDMAEIPKICKILNEI